MLEDTSSVSGLPSVENYIKKILLVSDNDAYNRLYEFVGRGEINKKLKKYGLNNTALLAVWLSAMAEKAPKHTNAIDFYKGDKPIYHQLGAVRRKRLPHATGQYDTGQGLYRQ